MKRNTARWTTTTFAAAALFTLPVAGFAQTAPTQPQSQTPPAQSQPPATPQTAQPEPATQDAAKMHLTAARNSLSQLTQLPAASQLQGDARAQVSQLITNFNELITTDSNWRASYAKVDANIDALIGATAAPQPPPATGTAGAVGATGTAGAVGTSGTTSIDPAVRAKLLEFRSHLQKFEEVAGGAAAEPARVPDAPTTATPPAAPPTEPPPTTQPPPARPDPEPASPGESEDLLRHVEAIEVILGAQAAAQSAAQSAAGGAIGTSSTASGSTRTTITSSDVRLTPEQMEQLRTHLTELRKLIEKK